LKPEAVIQVSRKFKNILNDCIDAMLRGESLEDCLVRYPEQSAELEPLLQIMSCTRETTRNIEPRPDFKAQLRYQVQSRIAERKEKARDKYLTIGWLPRWASITLVSVLILTFAAGSVYAISADTLPGDLLYPVKRAGEQVQLFFTFSNEGKAVLHATLASRRIEEIETIAPKADAATVSKLSSEFESNLQKVCELAAIMAEETEKAEQELLELKNKIVVNYAKDSSAMQSAENNAPDETKGEIATAREGLASTYNNVVAAISSAAGIDTVPAPTQTPSPTATTNSSATIEIP